MKNNPVLTTLLTGLICVFSTASWATSNFFTSKDPQNRFKPEKLNVQVSKAQLLDAQFDLLQVQLLNRATDSYQLKLPMPDGTMVLFNLQYSPVYQPQLAQRYPSIRTFKGYQVNKPQNSGRFDITPHGFHGMFRYNGQRAFIDPLQRGNNRTYLSYYKKDARPFNQPVMDQVIRQHNNFKIPPVERQRTVIAGETLKTYRIAIAAAGEYTEFHGGTKELAQAAIVTAINRVNEVYNVDLSVQLTLVDNDSVIYTDADTDPYDNSPNDVDANEAVMKDNIGSANYDIGHIMNTGGGGVAYLGVVCSDSKWAGVTGSPSPTGDPFVIDFVAHEIGHQFSAEHSFNGTAGECTTRSDSDAYEPGSGSTIMAYAGICDDQNLQDNSDTFFHAHSIEQISTFITDSATCASTEAINNEPPVVSAGEDFNIPASTPFKLTGSATDNDSDTLSYSWEQFDLGTQSSSSADMIDDGTRPLFRANLPTDEPVRYLPRLSDVVGTTTTLGETMATTSRNMTFKLMVRDGKGNTASDTMIAKVDSASGPFTVTAPTSDDVWSSDSSPVITWDVANTNQSPVSCANVTIILSTDSGESFDQTLLSDTPNDGSESISTPSVESADARVKVMCSDNIFFAVNSGDFTIRDTSNSNIAPEITGQSTLTVNEDESLSVEFADLIVTDSDSDYPAGFTMSLSEGSNYSLDGQTITPNPHYNGSMTVPVIVNDGTLDSNTFNLTVTVTAINDAPMITGSATFTMDEDTSLTITKEMLEITDVDTDVANLTLTVTAHDNYSVNGTTITPSAEFSGSLAVMLKVNDGELDSNTFELPVTVNPVDDPPIITQTTPQTIEEDHAITLDSSMLSITDIDTAIDAQTVQVLAGEHYTSDGATVTPEADYSGTLNVTLTVNDGTSNSNESQMTITIVPVNDAPTAVNDSFSVQENSQNNSLTVLTNDFDVDGDQISLSAVDYGGTGTVTIGADGLIYTPPSDFDGSDNLTYSISDGVGGISSASVTINVTSSGSGNGNGGSSSGGGNMPLLLMLALLPLIYRRRAVKGRSK